MRFNNVISPILMGDIKPMVVRRYLLIEENIQDITISCMYDYDMLKLDNAIINKYRGVVNMYFFNTKHPLHIIGNYEVKKIIREVSDLGVGDYSCLYYPSK